MIKKLSKYSFVVCAALVLPTFFTTGSAQAISWGAKQADGMICRELFGTPHDHSGRGHGNTRAEALAKALKRWTWFTGLEYGQRWSDWGIARRKAVKCGPGRRSAWKCKIEAQPCKH